MNYIVFDLEATCWNPLPKDAKQEVIEIGAVKINQFGEILDEFSSFVQPVINRTLSVYCRQLTHIEQNQVDKAQIFPQVIERWIDWIDEDSYLLLSWGSFDIKVLTKNCNYHRVPTDWLTNYADIKAQYPKVINIPQPTNLQRALAMEGFKFDGEQHRALSDAKNLAKIFVKYLGEWQY